MKGIARFVSQAAQGGNPYSTAKVRRRVRKADSLSGEQSVRSVKTLKAQGSLKREYPLRTGKNFKGH